VTAAQMIAEDCHLGKAEQHGNQWGDARPASRQSRLWLVWDIIFASV